MDITLAVIKTDHQMKFHQELIGSFEENKESIKEIIYTGNPDELSIDDVSLKCLGLESDNKGDLRNRVIEEASSDYILWISNSCEMDFDFIEEIREVLEEYPDADIIYPNKVQIDLDGQESVFKYDEFYGRELNLIRNLKLESVIPEWGVLTKRDTVKRLGGFDQSFEDYEFYDFLWRNIKDLKLKHAKFSFIIQRLHDTFIDTSYHSLGLRKNIRSYDIKEIFPLLGWNKDESLALSTAYYLIGDAISSYYDLFNASEYYRKSAISFHNKISIQKLVDSYFNMGLFEQAKELLRENQGFSTEEINSINQKIDSIKNLISEIEKAVMEGKLQEVIMAMKDVYEVYQGAPILNIIGVVEYSLGNLDNAYKSFYKAVTMNPLDEDVIQNLVDVAKQLKREEKVKRLMNRLLVESRE